MSIVWENFFEHKFDKYRRMAIFPGMIKRSDSDAGRYPIRVVSQRTGLKTPVIRAWERRYGTVTPLRTESGQRVYTEADIGRLQLLATLVDSGHLIGSIAELSTEALESLVEEHMASERERPGTPQSDVVRMVDEALDLVERLRPDDLERLLMRAAVSLRTDEVIHGLLLPLLQGIGWSWQTGRFGPGSEHVASVTIRRFLEWLSSTVQVSADSPLLLTGTPSGQRHEFGALLAGLVAADEGWRVRFLGPDLPGAEIARGAASMDAKIVALSALHPEMQEPAISDVLSIREQLAPGTELIIGGPAAAAHAERWSDGGILWYPSLEAYRAGLARIWRVSFGPPESLNPAVS